MPPPDVAAGGIGELDLQPVRRRRAADLQFDRPRFRHPARKELPSDDEPASAPEVEIETQRAAVWAGVAAEPELRLTRCDGAPTGDVAKVVKDLVGHGCSGELGQELVVSRRRSGMTHDPDTFPLKSLPNALRHPRVLIVHRQPARTTRSWRTAARFPMPRREPAPRDSRPSRQSPTGQVIARRTGPDWPTDRAIDVVNGVHEMMMTAPVDTDEHEARHVGEETLARWAPWPPSRGYGAREHHTAVSSTRVTRVRPLRIPPVET